VSIEIVQLDVKTAFLYLDKKMYMKKPESFICPGKKGHVCLLKNSLYALKQASRLWFEILDKELGKFGLKNSSANKCIYVSRKEEQTIIAIVHVEDFVFGVSDNNILDRLKTHLENLFQV
jgi:hypothetical protein